MGSSTHGLACSSARSYTRLGCESENLIDIFQSSLGYFPRACNLESPDALDRDVADQWHPRISLAAHHDDILLADQNACTCPGSRLRSHCFFSNILKILRVQYCATSSFQPPINASSDLARSNAFLEKSSVSARRFKQCARREYSRSQFLCELLQQFLPVLDLPSSPHS